MTTENKETECCSRFDPTPWDETTHNWEDKRFIKDKVSTFFYIPINFGSVMTRLFKKAEEASASGPDSMCLSDHTSKWKMDLLLAVDKEIPTAENTLFSGTFFSKVYEGNYNEVGKWMQDFEQSRINRKIEIEKTYTWYTTCPKCAKKYGKNYTVIIGKIKGL